MAEDIESALSTFSDQFKTLLEYHATGQRDLTNLVQFMHFVICRHVLHRTSMGAMVHKFDQANKMLFASRVDEGQEQIIADYFKDVRFTPLYYQLWSNSEPTDLPGFDQINGKSTEEVGNILNAPILHIQNACNDPKNSHLIKLANDKVEFDPSNYDELRVWLSNFNKMFVEASNLGLKIMNEGYSYSIDGETDLAVIVISIYRDIEKMYQEMLKQKDKKIDHLPSDLNEVMSLIYLVTASLSIDLEGPKTQI